MQSTPSTRQRAFFLWAFFALLLLAPFIPTLFAQQANREIQQARQAAANGDWTAAAQHMANAAAAQPGGGALAAHSRWEEAGHYALLAGDAQTAQLFLERAGMAKLSPQGLVDLGDAYQDNGNLAQAIQSKIPA